MKKDNITLKSYFETGDYPTETQFVNLIDSFLNIAENDAVTGINDHGDGTFTFRLLSGDTVTLNGADLPENIPIANIVGLQDELDSIVSITDALSQGKFDKPVGTASQFLKADGSMDSNSYWHSGNFDPAAKENAFSKNTAFNRNFGTAAGTVAEGNDPRITNGQTAFSWGDHASAGYLTAESDTLASVLARGKTAASDLVLTVAGSNNLVDVDSLRVGGYGLMGNRAALYFTNNNAAGTIKLGFGGVHNVGIVSVFSAAGLEVTGQIKKTGGLTSQFLKADGSVDSNNYATQSWVTSQNYQKAGKYWDLGLGGFYETDSTFDLNNSVDGDYGLAGGLVQNNPVSSSYSLSWTLTSKQYKAGDLLQVNYPFRGAGSIVWRNKQASGWTDWVKVWDEKNHGPGSGLDADMVDGIESNRIIYGDREFGTARSITPNEIRKSGFYFITSGSEGSPVPSPAGHLIHSNYDVSGDVGFQIWSDYNADNFFMRRQSQTGTAWRELWHSGNFDPSSKENAFSKNSAFNKNFGTAAGTVAEGNDPRINNGQTAYGWGNHAGLYVSLTPSKSLNISTYPEWITIATCPAGRAYGEFYVYDTTSSRHDFVKITAATSYGKNSTAINGAVRYATGRTIESVRILYNASNRTYGGAKLQVRVTAAINLLVRQAMSDISGWTGWDNVSPVAEGTPTGWVQDPRAYLFDITDPELSISGRFNADHLIKGTVAFPLLPTGTTADTVAVGNHTHPASQITAGTFGAGNYSFLGNINAEVTSVPSGDFWALKVKTAGIDNWSGIWTSDNNNQLLLRSSSGSLGVHLKPEGTSVFSNPVQAASFVRSAGTSSQFLKADGSVDSNSYWHAGNHRSDSQNDGRYLPKSGGTLTGDLTIERANGAVINLHQTNLSSSDGLQRTGINFWSGNNQGVRLYHEDLDTNLPIPGYGLVVDGKTNNTLFPATSSVSFSVLGEIFAGGTAIGDLKKVWHAGNFDPSLYSLSAHTHVASGIRLSSSDWGSYTAGRLHLISGSTNGPSGSTTFMGAIIPHSSGEYATSIAGRNGSYYFRSLDAGTWGAWNKIALESWVNANYVPKVGASNIQSKGKSTSWGSTDGYSTGAFNALMGTGTAATWLLSGTSGGVFRTGIQVLDTGGLMRFYLGSNFMQFDGTTLSGVNLSGNASTSTKLQAARTINGTTFDGTANIVTERWGVGRNLTIGSKTNAVTGLNDVAWTLEDIGAEPANNLIWKNRGMITATAQSLFENSDESTRVVNNGSYRVAHTGHSSHLITSYVGGSASVVQLGFHYSGDFQWRNRTDGSNWKPWLKVWHSGNFNPSDYISKTSNDTFTGKLYVGSTSSRDAGIYGVYDSYKIGHIWSMGVAYTISADGTSLGDLYGMAYGHSNSGLTPISGQHQTMFVSNGVVGASIAYKSGQIWTRTHGNSSQWKQAYDWGNHAGLYATIAHEHSRLLNTSYLTDLNTAPTTRGDLTYTIYTSTAQNKPVQSNNANGVISMTSHTGPYGKQLAFGDTDDLYMRRFTNNNFASWRKIWHSGNFDPSGYQPAGNYATTSALSGYLSKTSNDTFTGKLSVGSTSSRNAGLYGIYDSTKIGHIWGIGADYTISADGTGLGNFYGMAYGHSNSGLTPVSGQHQTMFVHSGLVGASIAYHSGQIWTRTHGDSSQWKQAYDWGNHAAAGYPTVSWTEGRYSRVVKNISDLANIGSAEFLPLFFYSGYLPSNRPAGSPNYFPGNYYSGIQFKHNLNEDYRTMLATDTSGAEPNLFIRTKINGTWHSGGWKRFWHDGDVAQPVDSGGSSQSVKKIWAGSGLPSSRSSDTIYFVTS